MAEGLRDLDGVFGVADGLADLLPVRCQIFMDEYTGRTRLASR
jgi:hypothetical protein